MKNVKLALTMVVLLLGSFVLYENLSAKNYMADRANAATLKDSTYSDMAIDNINGNKLASGTQAIFKKMANTKRNSLYKITSYTPMSKANCLKNKNKLGLKYCPTDNDHLAGAALACGNLNKLPSRQEIFELAKTIYNTNTSDPSIYGDRDDDKLKNMNIYVHDSHIFYWVGEEETPEDGVVRMFASKGSLIYRAPRNGSGYKTHAVGEVSFGDTKHIITTPEHDSNLVGFPNNDVLVLICKK